MAALSLLDIRFFVMLERFGGCTLYDEYEYLHRFLQFQKLITC